MSCHNRAPGSVGARSRIPRVRVDLGWLLALLLLPVAPPAAAADPQVDLVGTWFVLIHYKDSVTKNADSSPRPCANVLAVCASNLTVWAGRLIPILSSSTTKRRRLVRIDQA